MPKTPRASADIERGRKHESRVVTRLTVGAALGSAAGALAGLVVGLIVTQTTGPLVTCILVGLIGLGGLGALWGRMAGLESPGPSEEPMQTEHSLAEPAATREQRSPHRAEW